VPPRLPQDRREPEKEHGTAEAARLALLPDVLTGDLRTNQRGNMDQTSINREFVKRHFEAVNRRDVPTVLGNMRPDLYDHELQGDHKNDLQEGAQRLQVLMKQVPDLTVNVRDVIADWDKVVVRAVWLGTDAVSQRKVEFHGFVQWRIVEGKFAERWATVTPLAELPEGMNVW
jgi:ketosteroid isomerase-like protein